MKTTVQTITPEQAAAWLHPSINTENRPLRQDHVAYLAKEIIEGRRATTHQGLAFALSGRLLDGQHRLAAIVRAGKAIDMPVTTGLDEDAFRAIDCGLKRANYDRIHFVDDQNQNRLICMALRQFIVETGTDSHPSVGELEDEFLRKTDAWVWIGQEFAGINGRLRKAGVLAALGLYRFVKPDRAAEFMDGYRDGVGLELGSPVLRLRNDALTGTHRECSYWRSMALMRAHLHGQHLERVYEAAEDMMGNKNTARTVAERSVKSQKAAATRYRKGA